MTDWTHHKLIWIAGAALALRLLFVVLLPGPNYFAGISSTYFDVADNVLQGRGMVTHVDVAPLSASSRMAYVPFIDRPLGYVLLILIPYGIIHHAVAQQIFQAILAALSCVLLYRITARLTNERTAVIASLLYACWPLSARFEVTLLPDAVMPFFLLLAFWLFLRGRESGTWYWYGLSGLAFGTGIMMRPDILFLPFLLAAGSFLFKPVRKPLASAVILLAGMVFVIGLHTARNYSATDGRFLPLGLGNGISMWEGISQFGDAFGTVYGDQRMTRLEGYRSWAYPDGIDRDQKRFREALTIIGDHPFWYAGVMVRRIPVLLTPDWIMTNSVSPSLKEYLDGSPDHTIGSYLLTYPWASLTRALLILLQYATLALAALALASRKSSRLLWLPGLMILYYVCIHIPTNAEARYFYPVLPFVLLLASERLDSILQIFHAR